MNGPLDLACIEGAWRGNSFSIHGVPLTHKYGKSENSRAFLSHFLFTVFSSGQSYQRESSISCKARSLRRRPSIVLTFSHQIMDLINIIIITAIVIVIIMITIVIINNCGHICQNHHQLSTLFSHQIIVFIIIIRSMHNCSQILSHLSESLSFILTFSNQIMDILIIFIITL